MLALRFAGAAFAAGEKVDSALRRVPLYRWPRDAALDTIFGRPEDFEYVSTTAPATPPPTH